MCAGRQRRPRRANQRKKRKTRLLAWLLMRPAPTGGRYRDETGTEAFFWGAHRGRCASGRWWCGARKLLGKNNETKKKERNMRKVPTVLRVSCTDTIGFEYEPIGTLAKLIWIGRRDAVLVIASRNIERRPDFFCRCALHGETTSPGRVGESVWRCPSLCSCATMSIDIYMYIL